MRLIIILLLSNICACHGQEIGKSMTIKNFDSKIQDFDFGNINAVAEKDYQIAKETLKQIEETLQDKGEYTSSVYWNYCHVFYKLRHFELIEVPFAKAFNSNTPILCELLNLGHASVYQPYIQVSIWDNCKSQCNASPGPSDSVQTMNDTKNKRNLTENDIKYYRSRLVLIGEKDQQRTEHDWGTQNNLDSINRVELDELYNKFGFPSLNTIGEDAFTSAIMILHHSSDCEWNEKWLLRFINNYHDLSKYKNLFNFMILRTYGNELGICNLSQNAKNKLNTNYDREVLNTLGIDKLLEE